MPPSVASPLSPSHHMCLDACMDARGVPQHRPVGAGAPRLGSGPLRLKTQELGDARRERQTVAEQRGMQRRDTTGATDAIAFAVASTSVYHHACDLYACMWHTYCACAWPFVPHATLARDRSGPLLCHACRSTPKQLKEAITPDRRHRGCGRHSSASSRYTRLLLWSSSV